MQTRELVDLAAFIAAEAPLLSRSVRHASTAALGQYWTASKCRLERWNHALRQLNHPTAKEARAHALSGLELRTICEEVLVSEMLTRVWSGVLMLLDVNANAGEAQPVASSVLAGHLEVSNRVLNLIADDRKGAPAVTELNRLRRLTERWTNLLLGSFASPDIAPADSEKIFALAHDSARAREFAREFVRPNRPELRLKAWALLAASLKATFAQRLASLTPNGDLNARIAASIMGCFPSEVFDSAGVYHSLWMLRLSASTTDTQLMVEDLLAADAAKESAAPFSLRRHLGADR